MAKKERQKRKHYASYSKLRSWNKPSPDEAAYYVQQLLSSSSIDSNMQRLFERSQYSFFGDAGPYYFQPNTFEYKGAKGRCLEWFVFDTQVTIGSVRLSPAGHWLNLNKPFLSSEDVKVYNKMLSPLFSVFEVSEVNRGRGIRVFDVWDDTSYYIYEKMGSLQIKPGNSLVGRLFPWRDHYTMSGVISVFPKGGFKGLLNSFVQKGGAIERFNALTWEMYFKLNKKIPIDTIESLEELRKKFAPFLALVTNEMITWEQIIAQMQQTENVFDVVDHFMPKITFFTGEEKQIFANYLMRIWNYVPRPSSGGVTPEERAKEIGELEKRLIREMVEYVSSQIFPEKYPTGEKLIAAANDLKEKWLNTPQRELNNKTPLMAIMAERESLGNTSREFEFQIEFRRL